MSRYWLFIMLSSIGSTRLQFVNTEETGIHHFVDSVEPESLSSFYSYYLESSPSENELGKPEVMVANNDQNRFYQREDDDQSPWLRIKRTTDSNAQNLPQLWLPSLQNHIDKKPWLSKDDEREKPVRFVGQRWERLPSTSLINSTDLDIVDEIDKKSFSPWGGKRGMINSDNARFWSWKRNANLREPTMPKRVRFSPWGGKRNGQFVFKPGFRASKIYLPNNRPEMTQGNSLESDSFNIGFPTLTSREKRHPVRLLTLSAKLENRNHRDSLPFNAFLETSRSFKPGRPFADVNLKKDGKRKVTFSAWGGKRSPPIIGPIWTPPLYHIKENRLNAILLVRNISGGN